MPEIPLPHSVLKLFRPKEHEKRQTFKALRELAIEQSRQDTQRRVQTNPQMTPFEQSLGVYVEELEPQVREAVVRMRELGYSTTISGFWGNDYHQIIQMDNALDPATKHTLQNMGVTVKESRYSPYFEPNTYYSETDIEFRPEIPDLEVIRQKWNAITAVFSPSGQPLLDRPRWMIVADAYDAREARKNQK